ncbi:peptidoglycan-binding domain-containing protein [Streptomyces sp. SJL17-4]|uniref:peptidoglycan-binding domain-containing protein n=1 Tax=Streptomyces sp. SJL17-4 TaxID=2967224 RepID=UPI0030CFD46F
MTGQVCPECGVQRPGCACARAELAAAEDFDPLRIRPYVTLDAPESGAGAVSGPEAGSGGAGSGGPGSYGPDSRGPDAREPDADGPPTAPLAAIRPDGGVAAGDGYGGYEPYGTAAFPAGAHPGGEPSETMPLLLRGVGDISPPPGHGHGRGHGQRGDGRGRGRRRGALVAAVAAVAVAGTAALAAAVLGGGEEPDDRAAVPDVTTSASLNLAVSEAPSPSSSSQSPEPTSSSPTPRETSASPSATSASPTPTTASPSASVTTTGAAAPPPASSSTPATAPTTTSPTTPTPPAGSPEEGGEEVTTLSLGASGQEVRELQRRLTAVWVYDGRINGRYDEEVRDAVARYQEWQHIPEDPEGVYGPETRRILEQNTSDI